MTHVSWPALAVLLLCTSVAVPAQAPTGQPQVGDTALAAPLTIGPILRTPQRRLMTRETDIPLLGTFRSRPGTTCPMPVHVPARDDAIAMPLARPDLRDVAPMPTAVGTCTIALDRPTLRLRQDSTAGVARRP